MMFYQLPPVGNPVCLSGDDNSDVLAQVLGDTYQAHFYASGTAALAAAIIVAVKFKSVENPEVILPAYGCPDLISAVVFAGAKPVLVDFEVDKPWMDLNLLEEKIGGQTVAIIAVNLFGLSERLNKIRALTESVGALLIEDSAQAFPNSEEKNFWQGDLVVVSFGRGKPVSMLGGGAVFCRQNASQGKSLDELLPNNIVTIDDGLSQRVAFWLKAKLYNWMISPQLYWLPQMLPFLHLGETRYHTLAMVDGIDKARLSMLPANIKAYRDAPMITQQRLARMVNELNLDSLGVVDLPESCGMAKDRRLLRYPLLLKVEVRDRLYQKLHQAGLGPSCMYPTTLPGIPGLESLLSQQGPFPAATAFAERLLTFPTHQKVSQADIDKMRQTLSH